MGRSAFGQHLYAMACNDAWANHRLLAAVARLPQAELVLPRPSFFGTILATLNHIVTVDWLYVDAIERALVGAEPHPDPKTFFAPEQPFATLEPLRVAQRAVDDRLLAATVDLDDTRLGAVTVRVRRSWGLQEDELARVLAHLSQHQFFAAAEAPLRAEELRAIGLSEGAIWGRADG